MGAGAVHGFLSPTEATPMPQHRGGHLPSLPNIRAAVIVPGFLAGKDEFLPLARSLTDLGIPSVVVPMPNWHWLPCLGGRSMRPYLEWIDFTVRHLAGAAGEIGTSEIEDMLEKADLQAGLDPKQTTGAPSIVPTKDPQLFIPDVSFSMIDCYRDLRNNPGLQPVGKFPLPKNEPMGKVALIGHSAGGWICRAYLSDRKYNGKAYSGHKLVHSLITLGSPHQNAPGPSFDGCEWVSKDIEWVNRESSGVRALAVGGTGYIGGSSGKLTQRSYGFCCNARTDGASYDGDGVTPIHSALAMKEYVPHADTMVLEDVGHFCWSDVFGGAQIAPELTQWHKEGRPWYGDDQVVETWARWL